MPSVNTGTLHKKELFDLAGKWQGYWTSTQLIFSGVADYQLNSGLNFKLELLSATEGSMLCNFAETLPGQVWTVTQFLAGINNITLPKVQWIEKLTGQVLSLGCYPNDNWTIYISSAGWTRSVTSYSAVVQDFGQGSAAVLQISVVHVDNHLELYSYNPNAKKPPVGPPL